MEGTFSFSAFKRLKVDVWEASNGVVVRATGVLCPSRKVLRFSEGMGIGTGPGFSCRETSVDCVCGGGGVELL